jgi:hypothetical protein
MINTHEPRYNIHSTKRAAGVQTDVADNSYRRRGRPNGWHVVVRNPTA